MKYKTLLDVPAGMVARLHDGVRVLVVEHHATATAVRRENQCPRSNGAIDGWSDLQGMPHETRVDNAWVPC